MILGDFNIKPGDSKDTKARVIPYLLDEEKVVSAYPLDGSVLTTSKVRAGKVKDEQIEIEQSPPGYPGVPKPSPPPEKKGESTGKADDPPPEVDRNPGKSPEQVSRQEKWLRTSEYLSKGKSSNGYLYLRKTSL